MKNHTKKECFSCSRYVVCALCDKIMRSILSLETVFTTECVGYDSEWRIYGPEPDEKKSIEEFNEVKKRIFNVIATNCRHFLDKR
jgi:hypothetical protein